MRNIYISILFISILISSCSKTNIEKVIPRQEFIKILTELHIADAILNERGLYDRKLRDSTESYYNFILIKHNITRKEFDDNLQYYAKDMQEFNILYDEVIANLKIKAGSFKLRKSFFNMPMRVIDSLDIIAKVLKKRSKNNNLWTIKKDWKLPHDGNLNKIKFEKATYGQAKYELSADIVLFKDDKSINPTMQMSLLYKDLTFESKDTTLIKDGNWHNYKLVIETNSLKIPKKIICKIVNHDKKTVSKHLEVNNIILSRQLVKRKFELLDENSRKLKMKVIK